MADIAQLDERYRTLCTAEDNKDSLIKDLLEHLRGFGAKLQIQEQEIDNQKRLVNSFRHENEGYKSKLDSISRDKDRLIYISVLVDGDCMNFEKAFVQNGKEGGHKAARELIQAVEGHVRMISSDVPASAVCKIRVYANVDGLTKAYREAGILSTGQSLDGFIHGFNQADEWCDFVDVGNGKECSDVKLKAAFKHDIYNLHCCRVVFCASTDNGYAHILRQHQESTRISLVEGPPFASEIKHVAARLPTTKFQNIFMTAKLTPEATFPQDVVSPKASRSLTPPTNYAAAARTIPSQSSPGPAIKEPINPIVRATLAVCLNAKGERVDQLLKVSGKESVNNLKARKLCNRFHILDDCSTWDCPHEHGSKLSSQELTDLIYIARSTPCPAGLSCADVNCIAGHCCAFGTSCHYNQLGCCKFDKSMHGVDKFIVQTVDKRQIV
ncbi:hypothetical protein BJY01DRAFT_230051 [Aspergillus pseudoustus]|uniref:C-x8-C-x5-C-x3-H type zinc finger protein n=1 Tax=Aspergillus pseudoustus TaxID=1810923 RepID=A0ABR4IDP3_9EURO